MTIRKRKWLLGTAFAVIFTAVALAVAGFVLAGRMEPYARQQAIMYLSRRFASDVQIRELHLRVPEISPLRLLLTRHWGISAQVEGEGLSLRKKGTPGAAPLISISRFSGTVDLDSLFHPPILVPRVAVDGMEIQIPPRSGRPPQAAGTALLGVQAAFSASDVQTPTVVFQRIDIAHADLVLLPRDHQKLPLRFEIQRVRLDSAEWGAGMSYDASLTNAKPPGQIHTTGRFGPWNSQEPGETPVAGDYLFENADLGVFSGIAGILRSQGRFEGQLSTLTVRGQASVPDFRLRRVGKPVPLAAKFEVQVDATDGNTTLQPVAATLGSTNFITRGAIIKHEANQPRAVSLDVKIPNGYLPDVLVLVMRQPPSLDGRLQLEAKLDIPPLAGKIGEKLIVDGHFQLLDGRFHDSTIPAQLDRLSHRTPGKPEHQDAGSVAVTMAGVFHLEDAWIHFSELSFAIPWAAVDMTGDYNLEHDAVNFDGTVKPQVTVSQMATGWKRLALTPVDKLLERASARIALRVQVTGTSKSPQFDLNLRRN